MLGCAANCETHAGVGQDCGHLGSCRRLVDGDDDGAGEPRCHVGQRPLVPGGGHDGERFAGPESGGDEALGQGPDLVHELPGGHRAPRFRDRGVGGAHLEGDVVRGSPEPLHQELGRVPVN
ncbi:hypothetical protein D9M72_434940 [compost metagenome]